MSDHLQGVIDHKQLVAAFLCAVSTDLFQRAAVHDNSKFSPEEFDAFERMTPLLKTLTYGTDAYKEALKELGPALQHHYAANDHHPEHFEGGISQMNLIELTEMVCDWMAAIKRVNNGDIEKSLETNRVRFGIEPQLYGVIKNTVTYLQVQAV